MITVLYIPLHICFAVNAQSGSMPLKGTDLDIVRLRFEAQQCHLRAIRSKDTEEVERLHILGGRLTALADQAEQIGIAGIGGRPLKLSRCRKGQSEVCATVEQDNL